jgi:hypothetical protein
LLILAHSPTGSFVTNWLQRFDCAELVVLFKLFTNLRQLHKSQLA